MTKLALITGASSGIGEATARKLAALGYDLILTARRANRLEQIAEQIRSEHNVEVQTLIFDVRDESACEEYLAQISTERPIDVLVNNAGVAWAVRLDVLETTEESFDRLININTKGTMIMMREVCAEMAKTGVGSIVNVASVAGYYGTGGAAYVASKAAIIGMTMSAAKEFGARNIRVNAVAPGLIKTPMTDALTDEQKDKIFGQIALKRFGEVSEIASTVSFLLSEEASYITGQTIEISGGLAM